MLPLVLFLPALHSTILILAVNRNKKYVPWQKALLKAYWTIQQQTNSRGEKSWTRQLADQSSRWQRIFKSHGKTTVGLQ